MKKLLLDSLQRGGFERSRGVAVLGTEELTWIVELDRSPRTGRLAVDVGCQLRPAGSAPVPTAANDCHIYVALENLPLNLTPPHRLSRFDDYRSLTTAILDERTDLEDDERAAALRALVEPLISFLTATSSRAELRQQMERGAFDSAFVHREARSLLVDDE